MILFILEENKLQYVSFPNPASEGITITPSPDRAFIYNMNGQQWELLQINNRWDISHLPPGSYVLRAFSRNGETEGTTRLIIQ